MKFSNQLDGSMVPEWRPFYINYKALKKKLKQAQMEQASAVDFLAASPQTTSLSIARSLATGSPRHAPILRQQLQQQQDSNAGGVDLEHQQEQQQQPEQPVFLSAYGLAPSGTAQEQFLQMLQQDLANVRDHIVAQAAALSTALEALAAAAPRMAVQDTDALEQEAQGLGQQLLALEQFVHINQTGFVKIVKKHDKKTPWLQEQQRQFMWAALSSCYYYLHASVLASSRRRRTRQQQQKQQQQQQQQQRGDKLQLSSVAQSVAAATATAAAAVADVEDVSDKASSRFLPSALGAAVAGAATAAVAGAASAVAGAATAVAGAATAVAGAAAAAATSRSGSSAAAKAPGPPAVNFTRKFWVAQEDVSAVIYTILQQLPLLPSASHSSISKQKQQQAGFGARHTTAAAAAAATTRQQQQQPPQQQQQQLLQEFAGFTTRLHTVYFDNKGLELYHGRLYLRPNTLTLKARWIGYEDEFWAPAKVVLERKVYREGWRGERNIKDALLIAGEIFPAYLVGTYSLGDALSQLHELPALQQTLEQTLSSLQQRRYQQRQAAQQKQLQLQQQSPFAAVNAAGEAAAAAAAAATADGQAGSSTGAEVTTTAAKDAEDAEVNAALAAAGLRIPAGVVLGASFSRNSSGGGSFLAMSCDSQQDLHALQQQQQLPRREASETPVPLQPPQQQQQQDNCEPPVVQLPQQQLGRAFTSVRQQQQQQQQQQEEGLSIVEHSNCTTAATTAHSIADSSDDDSDSAEEDQYSESKVHSTATYAAYQPQPGSMHLPAGTTAAAGDGSRSSSVTTDPFIGGFEDAYLDPPMPTADQLSLFTEVQKFVTQKRLRPVLHCVLQRMLFAMPFDDRIKITLDTDVGISAVDHYQLLQEPSQTAAAAAAGAAALAAGLPFIASEQAAAREASALPTNGKLDDALQEAAAANLQPCSSQQAAGRLSRTDSLKLAPLLSVQLQQQQQQHEGISGADVAAGGVFEMFDMPFDPAIFEQEDLAYDTWESIYSVNNSSSDHSPPRRGGTGSTPDLTYGMPYALLKVSLDLPAGQNPPDWLLQLMDSELLSPVEDWSKFVHGCAVLLPEAVRAVPYWIDDPLMDLSVQAIQAELDAAITKREEQLKLAAIAAAAAARGRSNVSNAQLQQQLSIGRSSLGRQLSGALARNSSGMSSRLSQGLLSPESPSGRSSQQSSAGGAWGQQQQQLVHQRSSRISRLRHSSSTGGLQQQNDLLQQPETSTGTAGVVSSSEIHAPPHKVTWGGNLPEHSQVPGFRQSTAGASGSSLVQLLEPATPPVAPSCLSQGQLQTAADSEASSQQDSTAVSTAAAFDETLSSRQIVRRLSTLMQSRKKPPPLFRPDGHIQGGWRKRWGHPVQLLECREFFHSEAVFLEWLRLAITMASVAVLLLGYSAMAYVNPLKKPMIHVAEIITLLMLPSSCIIVAYAMRVYIWRGKRLHSMRYRRVDDQVGPNLMTAVFVTAMVAIFLVNMADLLLILKYRSKHQGDDPEEPDEPDLVWLFTQPHKLLQHLL